jgi:hypothetical protein
VIDVGFGDISEPIDRSRYGLVIKDLNSLNKSEVSKFVKKVLDSINFVIPSDADIDVAIQNSIKDFEGKLNIKHYYPERKFQSYPMCGKCGILMKLQNISNNIYYVCETLGCGNKIKAEIS